MELELIKNKILELDNTNSVKFIVLFGSTAKKTNTPLSDIDVAVYYDQDEKQRFKFRMKVLGELSDKVDLHIFQDLPLTVQKEVLGGKMLYQKDFQFTFSKYMEVIKKFDSFEKYYQQYFHSMEKRAET